MTYEKSKDLHHLSHAFLKIADSIHESIDRETLAEFIASYLYYKSKRRTNAGFANFMMTKRFTKVVAIALSVLPAVLPRLFADREFRSLIVSATVRSFRKH